MTESIIFAVLQDIAYFALLIGGGYLFGKAFYKIYKGEPIFAGKAFVKVEGVICKAMGINPKEEMTVKKYALSVILFSVFGLIFFIAVVMLQSFLVLNPEGIDGMSWHLAFITAASFGWLIRDCPVFRIFRRCFALPCRIFFRARWALPCCLR